MNRNPVENRGQAAAKERQEKAKNLNHMDKTHAKSAGTSDSKTGRFERRAAYGHRGWGARLAGTLVGGEAAWARAGGRVRL